VNQKQRIEFAQACLENGVLTCRHYEVWRAHEVEGESFFVISKQILTLRGDRFLSVPMCYKLFNEAKILMDCEYQSLYPEHGGILSDPMPIGVTVSFGSHTETRQDTVAEAADWQCRIRGKMNMRKEAVLE
jgi:hypothetical protein